LQGTGPKNRGVSELRALFLSCLCIAGLLLGAGCVGGEQAASSNLSVAVGIPPLEEFARAVGGDQVRVSVILPPGADPHTFEPTPQQIVNVSRVHLILAVGSGLPFEDRLLQGLTGFQPAPKVVNLSEGIELIDQDPHDWLSVTNARKMVNSTTDAFCAQDPVHCGTFSANRDIYLFRLQEADARIRATLAQARITSFLVVHPAWGYFAREYGLTEIAIEKEGKEPTASEVAQLIETARSEGIRVVFVEPQFSTREADILAAQLNGTVTVIDPLAQNYIDNLEQVAKALQEA
jgi:zinc transport system substrate-binding protein